MPRMREIRDIDKNMDTFQVLFTEAKQDRSSLLTTASQAGYHAGNVTAVIAIAPFAPAAAVPPPTEHALAMARVQATADATQAQIATLIAAVKTKPATAKTTAALPTVGLMVTPPTAATPVPRVKKQAGSHEVTATKTNTMGGLAHVYDC